MTPARFDYLRAETVDEALAALAAHGDEAALLAGGQSLVPMLCFRLAQPGVVVDIGGLDGLSGVAAEKGVLRLGALVRHRTVEHDPVIARAAPLLAEAARWVATPTVRNAGTLGGALALGDPAAEYPAIALALGARMHLASAAGTRVVEAERFFLGAMDTALAPDEMLVEVEFDAAAPGDRFGFHEIAERRGDYALAGAAVAWRADGDLRVAVFGAGDSTFLAGSAGAVLASAPPEAWDTDLLEAASEAARSDLAGSAQDAVRARLAGVAVARAARHLAEAA